MIEITEIRVELAKPIQGKKFVSKEVLAYCSITFNNAFVIRGVKIIWTKDRGNKLLVAMPSEKRMYHCSNCQCKNHLRANFCNNCGQELHPNSSFDYVDEKQALYADVAHPIGSDFREKVDKEVIKAFRKKEEEVKTVGHSYNCDE